MIIASSFAGRWVAIRGPRIPVAFGCLAAGAGVLLTDVALLGKVNFVPLVLSMTLAGIGFGVAVVPITSVALSSLPSRHSGMAASATTTAREVGTVLGVAALGSLFNRQLMNFLTQKLIELGVPDQFREYIITQVLTGQSIKLVCILVESSTTGYGKFISGFSSLFAVRTGAKSE